MKVARFTPGDLHVCLELGRSEGRGEGRAGVSRGHKVVMQRDRRPNRQVGDRAEPSRLVVEP